MSDESVGGPVDRDVGRQRHWTDAASRDELEDYCRHAEDDLRAQAEELDRLRAENDRYSRERMDLALLVARLVRRLRAARDGKGCLAGDDAMASAALEYLQRKGLSSPLRNETPNDRANRPSGAAQE
jgi:hypothetical protein